MPSFIHSYKVPYISDLYCLVFYQVHLQVFYGQERVQQHHHHHEVMTYAILCVCAD